MVERGDWLVPYYRGEPFFDKPPLTYWLMAAGLRGSSASRPGAARLVPAAGRAAACSRPRSGSAACSSSAAPALCGGVVLATSLAFVIFGRVAMSDMLLTLLVHPGGGPGRPCLPRGLAAAWRCRPGRGPGPRLPDQGPVAVLFPGLALLVLVLQSRRARSAEPGATRALARAARSGSSAASRGSPRSTLRLGRRPLEYFFLRENLERFAGETYDCGRPLCFYLGTYFAEGAALVAVPSPGRARVPGGARRGRERRGAASCCSGSA